MNNEPQSPTRVGVMGASGLVGAEVIALLTKMNVPHYAFTRTDLAQMDSVKQIAKEQKLTHVICALGTTIKKAKTKELFYKVEHDLVIDCAKNLHEIGVQSFAYVSAIGANPHSKNFYLATKGQIEKDLNEIGFKKLMILNPSLLLGDRKEFRLGELLARKLSAFISPFFIGPLKPYQPIYASEVAKQLISIL